MTPSQRVSAVFAEQFEQQPDLLVRAPGRVNPSASTPTTTTALCCPAPSTTRPASPSACAATTWSGSDRRRLRQPARPVQSRSPHRAPSPASAGATTSAAW